MIIIFFAREMPYLLLSLYLAYSFTFKSLLLSVYYEKKNNYAQLHNNVCSSLPRLGGNLKVISGHILIKIVFHLWFQCHLPMSLDRFTWDMRCLWLLRLWNYELALGWLYEIINLISVSFVNICPWRS